MHWFAVTRGVHVYLDSLMGSLNCVRTKCSLRFTADRSGDQLLELEVKHNGAAGVSRTDANVMVKVGKPGAFTCSSKPYSLRKTSLYTKENIYIVMSVFCSFPTYRQRIHAINL